ncbi:MAG: type IV toxin-antitoxin system AbiEi family antitoxin domain-containing protein [Pseudonocardiaceae bacterium]
MPGRVYQALFEVAVEQYGYLTAKDARELGFGPGHLVDLARRGDLDRVAHGVYRFKVVPVTMRDQLMEAVLWPRGVGVISHATALDLWDLCDVNPAKVHVTVPKSQRIRRKTPPAYEVHVRDLDATDITRSEGITVVTVRRAILDGITAHMGGHLIDQAVYTAIGQGLLTTAEQTEITAARTDRVETPARPQAVQATIDAIAQA